MHCPSERRRSAICSRRLGKYPSVTRSAELGLNDPFVSVHQSGGSVDSSSGKPESHMVLAVPDNVRREPNSLAGPTRVVRRTVHKSRFLMATASSTFGNKKYVVEVGASKQPIKAVFRESTRTMLIGLVFGLASATLGGLFLVKRALASHPKDRSGSAGVAGNSLRRRRHQRGRCPPTHRKSMRYLKRNGRSIGGLLSNWNGTSRRGF